MRKQYNHPNSISKESTKIWLTKWVIWHVVETSAVLVLCSIMQKLHLKLKTKEPSNEAKALLDAVLKSFGDYTTKVRQKYFMQGWALKKDEKSPHVRCHPLGKEVVYRFIYQEKKNIIYFPIYPIFFWPWLECAIYDEGGHIYGFYSMYPTNL